MRKEHCRAKATELDFTSLGVERSTTVSFVLSLQHRLRENRVRFEYGPGNTVTRDRGAQCVPKETPISYDYALAMSFSSPLGFWPVLRSSASIQGYVRIRP